MQVNFVSIRYQSLCIVVSLSCALLGIDLTFAKSVEENNKPVISTMSNSGSGNAIKSVSASTTNPMDLIDLWSEALSNNPQLRQMRESYLSAKAIGPQLAAPNNPQIGFIWQNTPASSPLALGQAGGGSYSITQSLPFYGKKSLAAGAADDQAEALLAQNENNGLLLASQLANAYYSAIAAQKQLLVLKETVLRLEMVKNLTKARYANNAAAYTEYLNAQVAQSSAEADRFAMDRQVDVALRTINTILGRDPREKILLRSEPDFTKLNAPTLIELEEYAEFNHPALKSSRLQLESAKKQLTLAKLAYLPDFQIIATSNHAQGPFTGGNPATSYQLEVDIIVPLFFFMKERYGVEQAARNKNAFEMNDVSLRQQIVLGVDSAYASYEQARNQVLFLRDRQLPDALAAYKIAFTTYANNGQQYNDLMLAQTQLRNLQVQLAVNESNLAQNHAALLAAAGKDPISK